MTDLTPAYGLSYASKTRRSKSPEDLMREILEANPALPDEEIYEKFLARVRRSGPLIEICIKGFGVNILRAIRRLESPESIQQRRAERKLMKADREQKVKSAVIETISWMAHAVFSLTFGEVGELARAAPHLKKIARMGKSDQRVSDVLTLAQLTKLLPT